MSQDHKTYTHHRLPVRLRVAWRRYSGKVLKALAISVALFVVISSGLVLVLKWVPPPTSSFMQQRSLAAWWQKEEIKIHYQWTSWDEISPYVKVAAITSEDQNFPSHWGFDIGAIRQAINEYQRGQGLRGASTITQQTAKNLFLWPGESFFRKAVEAYFTVLIELFWSKQRILEIYLNIAEFGDGIYGVQAAARTYFDRSADNLNMIQSALMITALPSPKRYNLADPSPYMIDRRNWILTQMFYLGNTQYLERL